MSVPAYPAYRNSGVEWLGEVPAHWRVMRLRFVTAVNPPKSEVAHLPDETEVTFLPMEAIGEGGELDLSRTRPIGEVRTGYSYLTEGDVIFAKVTPCLENGKGALAAGLEGGRAFATTEVTVLRPAQPVDGRFLWWLTSSKVFRGPAEGSMYGAGGLKRVSDDWVADYRAPWPPEGEREAIAAFLDRETGKIDALVEEQRRLIALLKEKRQAVISHTVTKGLNPQASLKPSGIEWLGDIPAHWEVRKLTDIARLESGHTPSRQRPDYWVEEDCIIPWFTLADVGQLRGGRNLRVRETSQRISELGMANSAARLLPKGTVILSRTASVGFPGITEIELAVSQDFAAWICGPGLEPDYLLFTLQAMRQEFDRLMMGSTHQTIYMPDIEAFRIPVPPPDEQLEIAGRIASVLTRLDALSDGCEQAQGLLQERRAALISAAVTGRIDVRGLVATPKAKEAA